MSNPVCVEYVWIGGNNELRSKTKVIYNLQEEIQNPIELPKWNYDGSSTNQSNDNDSEVIIVPRALFKDPFRGEFHKLCLCDTYKPNGEPLENNNRQWADKIFAHAPEEQPWFGLEQEYFIIDKNTNKPLGFPKKGNPEPQGQYYCSVGADNAFGREIAEEHLGVCIYSGINISGINAEVAPGQWEFQIGPCIGIEQGDHMWMARYLLYRIAEKHGLHIDIEPKPVKGEWNGSGCHANYSTQNMREGDGKRDGLDFINEAIGRLSKKHKEHMEVYGTGNEERMTGKHETASYTTFSDGIANRGASIRRGNETVKNKKGYFEDRRPSSNCDPYLVTGKLFETTVINQKTIFF